jgi:hypothetical protein
MRKEERPQSRENAADLPVPRLTVQGGACRAGRQRRRQGSDSERHGSKQQQSGHLMRQAQRETR